MIENIEEYIAEIRKIVSERLDLTHELDDEDIRGVINQIITERSAQSYISLTDKKRIMDGVFNSMRGLDVLQPLVDDPSITEIMINGPDDVFIEQGGRLFRKNISFGNSEKLENVIQNIVSKVNRTVNESTPIVDAGCCYGRFLYCGFDNPLCAEQGIYGTGSEAG